ncbi:gamma-secretase subunit Aph-1 [Sporodiniella umbellata]|nr:gamma-secretase subunit Aph-1 [Sporodiniella umbellata]
MTLISFFGCFFLAYGPIVSIFFLTIAPNAQYVLLTVSSAFFCLLALLISSVIWYVSQSNQWITIAYTVAIQELGRYGLFRLSRRARKGLNTMSAHPNFSLNPQLFALVFGFGYALTQALVGYLPILVASAGPGLLMCPSCPEASLYFITAITTSLFSLLHIVWMVLAFEGWDRPYFPYWLWVLFSHWGASYTTTLNSSPNIRLGCVYSIVICFSILVISALALFRLLNQRLSKNVAINQ